MCLYKKYRFCRAFLFFVLTVSIVLMFSFQAVSTKSIRFAEYFKCVSTGSICVVSILKLVVLALLMLLVCFSSV